ncbi:MAG: prepilin-type N-terminal cleavage/methylation domain-containing protein [Candidatus Paceibacterota bacterium]|jgi:prepilin-type N-terminal cleavage/methylation domain-containing protein
MNKKGFTLIELLVVISIISFLSSIVLSSAGSVRARSKTAAANVSLHEVKSALQLYATDTGGFPVNINSLVVKSFISSVSASLSYYPLLTDTITVCSVEPCASYVVVNWQTPDPNRSMTWDSAVAYCHGLGEGWRLPSKQEIFLAGATFQNVRYWTSDEFGVMFAYFFNRTLNKILTVNKTSPQSVRCVM